MRASSFVVPVVLASALPGAARADDEKPVFEGHPALTIRTKEVAVEGSATRLGDGHATLSGGAAVASFYKPWLSLLGGATFSPGLLGARQHYDTRAVARLVWPEPIVGSLFVYAGVGASVFFYESERASNDWRRSFGPVGALGAFAQVADKFRIRLEARDHWLFVRSEGMRHNVFVTLSLVTLYR